MFQLRLSGSFYVHDPDKKELKAANKAENRDMEADSISNLFHITSHFGLSWTGQQQGWPYDYMGSPRRNQNSVVPSVGIEMQPCVLKPRFYSIVIDMIAV